MDVHFYNCDHSLTLTVVDFLLTVHFKSTPKSPLCHYHIIWTDQFGSILTTWAVHFHLIDHLRTDSDISPFKRYWHEQVLFEINLRWFGRKEMHFGERKSASETIYASFSSPKWPFNPHLGLGADKKLSLYSSFSHVKQSSWAS